MESIDNLRKLLEKLKTIGFLERIFGWGAVRSLLIESYADIQRLLSNEDNLKQNLNKSEQALLSEKTAHRETTQKFSQEKEVLQEKLSKSDENNRNYVLRGMELRNETERLKAELVQLREENTKYKTTAEERSKEYQGTILNFNKLSDDLRKERTEEINSRHAQELERINQQKETWSNHEENVRNRIKAICNRHAIEYVDKVPFKGNPDNTLKIKDEYIVFDAKSPRGEDLSNFQSAYLKNQVEGVIKYVKEEDVRKEVFLVVPTNTLEVIEQFEHRLADYTVYIISIDALEPIILALKKIEEYEFAEQLSPEERENICRVIGKFVHLSKRRIQIDGFFAKQFFELVYRSEADLPKDFLDKVVEFEKSEKLNPPIEKRAKQISTKELEADSNKIASEANQKGIITQDPLLSRELNRLPLYSSGPKNEDQGDLFGQ